MAIIVTKNSSTASSVPSSSDLVEGELAVNTADKRLFTENASAAVVELGTNPSTVTTTTVTTTNLVAGGLTYVTSDGDANQVLATNGSGALQWLTVSGVYDLATQAEAEAGTVTDGKIFSPLRVKQAIDALGDASVDWTRPGTIGSNTPSSGAFTTLSASSTFSLGGSSVTSTAAELNILDGVTSTTAELNILDGVTATATELNLLDGVTATTTELNYVDGVTSNIQSQIDGISPSPTYSATASGTLANGDTVIINADGTVSAVTGSSGVESLGADQNFTSAAANYIDSAYDASTDRLVVIYTESSTLYAKVGQVSGSTVTFGAATTVAAGDSAGSICYDPSASKVLVCYRLAGDTYGYGRVGTVTGGSTNSISFGTAAAFYNGGALEGTNIGLCHMTSANANVVCYARDHGSQESEAKMATISGTDVTFGTAEQFNSGSSRHLERGVFYDPDTERVVVCFYDLTDSDDGYACLLSNPSGTTLDAHTKYEFNNANTQYVSACYDTANNKGIVLFRDKGNNNYLTSCVMTIVGSTTNSITFGSETVIISADTTFNDCNYDVNSGKVVVIYKDETGGSNNGGKLRTGEISGTSSTWSDATELVSNSAGIENPSVIYDPDSAKTLLNYSDGGNSNYGTTNVFSVGFFSSNMTAENYIGISDAAYSSSATATIQIAGAVDDAQSSLTAGQKYYIQGDGSLGLTPASVSVEAGTAVSATKLIVKG